MIDKLKLYRGQSFDPFFNLAVEEYLLQNTDEGCCTLYLWQNQNTVVIGRNQNAFKECRTTLLEDEGGKLARRLSGGGAVFHDLGNLNFTFLVPTADYDLDKQLKVIELACEKLGVKVERSGRNDILADGRKFSGNAFYKNGPRAYHHGTLMVDVDREKMGRYLNPSKAKLSLKGVDSVRSRVVNLKELASDTTIELLSEKLAEAFEEVYGLPYEEIGLLEKDRKAIQPLFEKYGSWKWRFGREIPFTFECGERFPWGSVQIQLMVDSGRVKEAEVYSDSMDWSIAERLKQAFEGICNNVERRYKETQSDASKRELEELMAECPCPTCKGKRLKKESLAVTVGDKDIDALTRMSVVDELQWVDRLELTHQQHLIADRILKEIKSRLGFLQSVGLGYLTLSRSAGTLSGGESQRIRLATQIGSSLMGVLYILDEPSIGLHQRDNDKLLATLQNLRMMSPLYEDFQQGKVESVIERFKADGFPYAN